MRILQCVSVCLIALVFFAVAGLLAQESPQWIECPGCHYRTPWSYDYCINCGKSLKEIKASAAIKSDSVRKEPLPAAKRTDPPQVAAVEKAVAEGEARTGLVDPRRLFLIPTADVLGSLEVSIGGGSIIGEMKEEKRPFLGHVSFGLGDVAEIEASTIGMINGLKNGSAAIPTAAFKLKFFSESARAPYIGLAGALRSSLWHSEIRGNIEFQKRVATLYFVASKTLGATSIHGGLSISDLRIRTLSTMTAELISPTAAEAEETGKNYINKNIFQPLLGLSVKVNPRTSMMVEFEYIPDYDFDEEEPVVTDALIKSNWMVIAGLRFFINDWLPLDTGILYRGDYHGIGDMHIQAGLNINFSLPKVFQKMKTK